MHLHTSSRTLLAAMSASLLLTSTSGAQPVDLTPQIKVGDELRYTVSQNTVVVQLVGRQDSHVTTDFVFNVESKDDSGAVVGCVYEAMSVSFESGGMSFAYDSRNPKPEDAQNPLVQMLGQIVGFELQLNVSPTGQIVSIEGLETLLAGPGGQMLSQFADAEMIKRVMSQIFAPDHEHPTAEVGEVWTKSETSTLEGGPNMVMTTEMKLEGLDGAIAHLPFTGSAHMEPVEGAEESVDVELTNNEISGDVYWDTKAGILDRHTMRLMLEMTVTRAGMPSQQISIEQTSTTKRTASAGD